MRGLIDILDVAYDVESDDETWLRNVAEAARGTLDTGRGVIANTYDLMKPGDVSIRAVHAGTPDGFHEFFLETSKQLTRGYVKNAYLSATSCATTSGIPGFDSLPFVKSGELSRWGIADDLVIRGWVPSGRGITLNVFLPKRTKLTRTRHAHLSRLATHLGAAFRLRSQLTRRRASEHASAEAILDAGGRVEHAAGEASSSQARERLCRAAADIARARGALRSSPEDALLHWRSLVGGRWSLVDEFEAGSRRYLVACTNAPSVAGPEVLTNRERQVIMFTAAGHSTKLIAYELGIADSTVRVLLVRGRTKLGVKTLAELCARVATWPPPDPSSD